MVELTAKSPCEGLLPLTEGAVSLTEESPVQITSVTARKGQAAALSAALEQAHGMAMPKPNRATGNKTARALWFGRDQAMLIGPVPKAGLAALSTLVDQGDAWAVVRLEGAAAEAVLARLVPVDLRASTFKQGHTARTLLQHMTVSITRVGEQAFQIMAFRSMAKTLVHDLHRTMESVAARG